MTEYNLMLAQIVTWYRSKQLALAESPAAVVEIRERTELLPAAAADFSGIDTMGRINGWVSGEFDFEVVRVSDGKDLFWQHVDVSSVEALEGVYVDFLKHLLSPEKSGVR